MLRLLAKLLMRYFDFHALHCESEYSISCVCVPLIYFRFKMNKKQKQNLKYPKNEKMLLNRDSTKSTKTQSDNGKHSSFNV